MKPRRPRSLIQHSLWLAGVWLAPTGPVVGQTAGVLVAPTPFRTEEPSDRGLEDRRHP